MKRRGFLFSAGGITAGLSLGLPFAFAETAAQDAEIRITQPFNGAVLHRRLKDPVVGVVEGTDGKPIALKIKVSGEAPPDAAVTVDGIASRRNGKTFEAEIELRQKTNDIVVRAKLSSNEVKEARGRVLWLKNSVPRYCFGIDDTIFCLREIHRNNYKSIFDDYFLGNLQKLNRQYGMKVTLNLFYTTSVEEILTAEREQFNLSQFSDKYKSEWRDNADWLRLAFHAKREFPDRPYKDASVETLIGDYLELEKEVKRFAGEETYSPALVIHWNEIRPEMLKPLAAQGVKVLGAGTVGYPHDAVCREYLSKQDFLLDADSGIVFMRRDLRVLNNEPLDNIVPELEKTIVDPNTAEVVFFVTHEQYFWQFYKNYIPNHWKRLERAFGYVTERGYKPVFINDETLGLDDTQFA